MKVGEMIETAMVGRDGVVNGTSALDGKVSLHKGIVQVAGAAAMIDPDVLRVASDPARAGVACSGPTISRLQCQSHGRGSYVPVASTHARPNSIRRLEA